MNRSFKGIWIPAELWLDKNLTKIEVLFLTEIDSLDNESGCFAGNEYFEGFFRLSKSRCSEIINGLKKKGYIKISYEYDGKQIIKRIIKCTKKYKNPAPLRKTEQVNSITPSENRRPPSENTIDNNTINNTVSTSPDVEVKEVQKTDEVDELINHFNQTFGQRLSLSKKAKGPIYGIIKRYSLNDLKKVVTRAKSRKDKKGINYTWGSIIFKDSNIADLLSEENKSGHSDAIQEALLKSREGKL